MSVLPRVYEICRSKMYNKNTTKFCGEKWKYTIVSMFVDMASFTGHNYFKFHLYY